MRRWPAAVLAVVIAAACSDDDVAGVATSDRTDAWISQPLGEPGDDTMALLVADDDTLVAITTDQRGVLRAWVADEDGRFDEATTPAGDGFDLIAAAAGDGGFIAAGRTADFVHTTIWFSEDGREWTSIEDPAFAHPADVASIVAVDEGFVAAGALRGEHETFTPVIWRSDDGSRWEQVEVGDDEGGFGAVTAIGDTVIAAVGDALWQSDDGGRTWDSGAIDTPRDVDAIAGLAGTGDDTLVLVDGDTGGMGGDGGVWVSDDRGDTWRAADTSPDTAFDVGNSLWLSDRAAVLGLVGYEGVTIDPASCYVHLDTCDGGQPDAHVVISRDGATWRRLDLTGIDPPPFNAYDVGALPDGRVVVLGSTGGKLVAWTWDGDEPPTATTTTAASEPNPMPMAQRGQTLDVAVTYRFPLGLHCGIGHLGEFNGQMWAIDGPEPPIADHWPVAGGVLYGFVTMVARDRVEYWADAGGDEVIAAYAPYVGEPVMCG